MANESQEVVYPNLNAPSMFPAKRLWLRDKSIVFSQTFLKEDKCSTKRFVFGSDAIAKLKAEATKNGVQHPTRVEVVSSLIWKCAMTSSKEACGFQTTSRLTHFENLRRKLVATLSKDLIGNMIWISKALREPSYGTTLHGLLTKVRESISKIDVEFVNKAQGYEGYVAMQESFKEKEEICSKGTIKSFSFTSWGNMGFYKIDFGWGKPSWCLV